MEWINTKNKLPTEPPATDEQKINIDLKQYDPNEYAYGISITNQELIIKTIDGDLITISDAGVFKTTKDGVTTKLTYADPETPCRLCDDYHGCDNCYHHNRLLRCCNCVDNSEWQPLGDTYCRKCGRKLTK